MAKKSIPLAELPMEELEKKKKSYKLILGISFGLIIVFIGLFIYYIATNSWSNDKLPLAVSLAALGALSSAQSRKLKDLDAEIIRRNA